MPSRFLSLAILAFWLATAGWFAAREFAPFWDTGQPPPYVIEFADEALNRNGQGTSWRLERNGQEIGTLRTRLQYREADDTFDLIAESGRINVITIGPIEVVARDVKNVLRVTRDGGLRSQRTEVRLDVMGLTADVDVSAAVVGKVIVRSCLIRSPLGSAEATLPPVENANGSVLTTLHPVERILGLRPGRRWRIPLVNPIDDAAKAALQATAAKALGRGVSVDVPDAAAQFLSAEVLPATRELEWERGTHACYVIEYRGEDFTARTWVRVLDGKLLRQEVQAHHDELVLQRQ